MSITLLEIMAVQLFTSVSKVVLAPGEFYAT